jgi:hypothetical protein
MGLIATFSLEVPYKIMIGNSSCTSLGFPVIDKGPIEFGPFLFACYRWRIKSLELTG